MGWYLTGEERLECPPELQEALVQLGGLNRYGDPNFIITWSQTYTERRADLDGTYHDELADFTYPCWILKQWKDTEEYGSDIYWYIVNNDEATGLCLLGEFPYRGKYETLVSFRYKEMINGKLVIESLQLDDILVEMLVPIVIQSEDVSDYTKTIAVRDLKAKEREAEVDSLADRLADAHPAFTEPVSFARQGCRTSLIDKRVEKMQRHWDQMMRNARAFKRGLQVSK